MSAEIKSYVKKYFAVSNKIKIKGKLVKNVGRKNIFLYVKKYMKFE